MREDDGPVPGPPTRKHLLFAALALLLGLSLALAASEMGLRVYEGWASERRHPPEELDLLHPSRRGIGSYRLKPNLDVATAVGPYQVRIQTNRHGMRWREVSKEKTDARQRVGSLGDSFTFGCWAEDIEHSLVGVFEKSVSLERWEVLNFGVGGYGFADIELQLREEALEFDLSYAILVSFNGNDFRDTYLGIGKDRILHGTAVLDDDVLEEKVPALFLRKDRTTSQPSFETSTLRKSLQSFSLFRLLAPFLDMDHLAIDFRVNQHFIAYSFWSQVPYPPVAVEAKDVSLETLERMARILDDRGVGLALVALPTREQVYSGEPYGPGFDIDFPQAYLQLFAREQGIPYLDLLPIFREHVSRTNENIYVKGDTHLNNEGHALAGWHISEWFRCCVKNQPIGKTWIERRNPTGS